MKPTDDDDVVDDDDDDDAHSLTRLSKVRPSSGQKVKPENLLLELIVVNLSRSG